MAAYDVTKYTLVKGTPEDATAALETKIETVDDAKVIRLATIVQTADDRYCAVLIYDT